MKKIRDEVRGLNRYGKMILVVVLVICAMVSRMIVRYDIVTGPLNMGVSIPRSGIYIGLIIAWGVSIRKRVLHSSVRHYLLAIDGLLLFWMFLRTCKYLFLEGLDPARAFCWYAFYIPMLCIPLMAIFVAQCLGEVEYYTVPKIFRLLYLPNIFLILMVMTNHYHFLYLILLVELQVRICRIGMEQNISWLLRGWRLRLLLLFCCY